MSHGASATPDLIGLINRQISPDVIRHAAARLGEDRDRTASAISTSIPSVLTALSDVADSDTGAEHLKEVIDEERRLPLDKHPGGGSTFVPSRAAAGDHAVGFIDDELGTRAAGLADAVARSSGIKRDSAHKLVEGVTAVAVAAIAKNAGGMGSGALRTMFHEQRADWMRRLPAPVASLFDGSEQPISGPAIKPAIKPIVNPIINPIINPIMGPRWRNWLLPLLLVGLALLAIPFMRVPPRPSYVPPPQPTASRTAPSAPAPQPRSATPSPIERAPSPPGTTAELAAFLGTSEGSTPRTFAPTPLRFVLGSPQPTPDSSGTFDRIAAALRQHPSATVRVDSFADSMGSPESNLRLSQARAESIRSELVQRGVAWTNVEAVGLGQNQPTATSAAEIVVTGR